MMFCNILIICTMSIQGKGLSRGTPHDEMVETFGITWLLAGTSLVRAIPPTHPSTRTRSPPPCLLAHLLMPALTIAAYLLAGRVTLSVPARSSAARLPASCKVAAVPAIPVEWEAATPRMRDSPCGSLRHQNAQRPLCVCCQQ